MNINLGIRVVRALAVLLLVVVGSVQAASNPSLSITATTVESTCNGSTFTVTSGWTATDGDGVDCDVVGIIVYDANDVPVSSDWQCWSPPDTDTRLTRFGPDTSFGFDNINDMTARPLTVEMYDLDFEPAGGANFQSQYDEIVNAAAPVFMSLEYDPATEVAACAELPERITVDAAPVPATSLPGSAILALALGLLAMFALRTGRD